MDWLLVDRLLVDNIVVGGVLVKIGDTCTIGDTSGCTCVVLDWLLVGFQSYLVTEACLVLFSKAFALHIFSR